MAFPTTPTDYQIYKNFYWNPTLSAWRKIKADRPIGEIFSVDGALKEPSEDFPAICIDNIANYYDVPYANYPLLVNEKRQDKLEVVFEDTGSILSYDTFTATVSGTSVTLTGPTADSVDAMLLSLVEEAKFAAGSDTPDYTALARTLTISDTEYSITGINLGTDTLTVSTAPGDGTVSVSFYEHRVAGDTTVARIYSGRGISVITPGDPDGLFVTGVRRRGYMQGHWHFLYRGGGDAEVGIQLDTTGNDGPESNRITSSVNDPVREAKNDGTNGDPRTGPETHGPALVTHKYIWAGVKL